VLTIHTADLLVPGGGAPAVPGGAVLVRGAVIEAAGPYGVLAAAHPAARVRRWPGILTPGLLNPCGPELLEGAYHPDPREADELGTEPLTGDALTALAPDDTRWGASARRGVQRMLAHGTTAVAGELRREPVADAVARAGLTTVRRAGPPPGPPTLDPLLGRPLGEVIARPLTAAIPHGGSAGPAHPAGPADFAVFDVPAEAALTEHGAATCVATVLRGRIVHRRR
jgi:hypothetical protein